MLNIEICKKYCRKYVDSVLVVAHGKPHWKIHCDHAIPNYDEIDKLSKWKSFEKSDVTEKCPYFTEHCMAGWNKKGEKHEQKA